MPPVWFKRNKTICALWERRGQTFCDGCGMLIRDRFFYKWSANELHNPFDLEVHQNLNSHDNANCVGTVLLGLLKHIPELEPV